MARRNTSAVDPAERESIAETRRLYYEGLERGMSIADAVAYSKGQAKPAPSPILNEGKGTPASQQSDEDMRAARRAIDLTGWEDLPYIPREKGAPNLKALSTQVATGPVRNKADAEAAVRAEIELRAKEDAAEHAAIVIPDDWQGRPLGEKIALASQFTDDAVETEGDVERVIQTELARRAG